MSKASSPQAREVITTCHVHRCALSSTRRGRSFAARPRSLREIAPPPAASAQQRRLTVDSSAQRRFADATSLPTQSCQYCENAGMISRTRRSRVRNINRQEDCTASVSLNTGEIYPPDPPNPYRSSRYYSDPVSESIRLFSCNPTKLVVASFDDGRNCRNVQSGLGLEPPQPLPRRHRL